MADEEDKTEDGAAEGGGEAEGPPAEKPPLLPTLMIGVNILVMLGALGTFVYTRMLFQRPPIYESVERKKLIEKAKKEVVEGVHGMIEIKSLTANIRPTTKKKKGSRDVVLEQLHYATLSMMLEIRNIEEQGKFDEIRPIFMDKLLHILGRKSFNDLTTVQGRYVLRNEILEMTNDLLKEKLISDVFFNEFIVQ